MRRKNLLFSCSRKSCNLLPLHHNLRVVDALQFNLILCCNCMDSHQRSSLLCISNSWPSSLIIEEPCDRE
ncbi:hypothetical protein BS78_K089300 [Paspalum vaginatum]|uniref:Uncharacterized protein n=1 Tax=Paspalum vaginatum TaxID=158149 RepID=A0A9W8CCN9_9POAL|nr:hypothetical protein BS78_K089300 [Paspalum vaginatum]